MMFRLIAPYLVILGLVAGIGNVSAETDALGRIVKLDIAAQPLSAALIEFSKQAGVQVMTSAAKVSQFQTSGVKGEMSVSAALTRLLEGTTLGFHAAGSNTIGLDGEAEHISELSGDEDSPGARLVQAETSSPSKGEGAPKGMDEDRSTISEIIVTAQKREERLIDVPISIVAMSGDELQRRNVDNIDALAAVVPGLVVNQGAQSRQIMLRGVANSQGGSSLIGMYLDEASVTSAANSTNLPIEPDLHTYDVERVEVLRGPQGTLYGDGSAGGTVRVITRQPQLDRFTASTDVTASITQQGDPSGRIQGMANIPLVGGKLGLRIAGTYDRQGGWIDQPAIGEQDYNEQELMNVRIKGLWQPSPQFAVNAMAVIHRSDTAPNIGEDEDGHFTQVFGLTTTPSSGSDYDIYNLTLTYDFSAFQLLTTTTYIEEEVAVADQGRLYLMFPPPSGISSYLFGFSMEPKRLTEEIRLTSTGSGPWQWTLGTFYRDAESRIATEGRFGFAWAPGMPVPPSFASLGDDSSKSWSVFGDTSYAVTDRFTVGAGLRYFEDKREQLNLLDGFFQEGTFDSVDPRFYAKYKLTDRVNTYASATKGFRSGGFNTPFGTVVRPGYEPESIWTYELGVKSHLLEGRVSTDAAVFYTDYSDYQVVGVDLGNPGAGSITNNAGNVWIKGIELALMWRPADDWELGLNGTYIDSEFDKINLTAESSSFVVGDRPDYSVEYAYSASVQRDFQWIGGPGFARLDYSEQGPIPFRNRTLGPAYFAETDAIGMLNINLGLDWGNNVSLGLFAQNLLDNRDFTNPGWLAGIAPRSRPRTFGIKFGVRFD